MGDLIEFRKVMKKGFDWKPHIPLALKLAAIIWVASRLAYSIEINKYQIDTIVREQKVRDESLVAGKVEINNLKERMVRIESKLDKILEKL